MFRDGGLTWRAFHNQYFSGAASGIVVRSLRHTVCAGRPDRQNIAGLDLAKWPALQETIAGFADLTNYVYAFAGMVFSPPFDCTTGVMGCGASYKTGRIKSFIAASIITNVFLRIELGINDPGKQNTGRGDDRTARLQQQLHT